MDTSRQTLDLRVPDALRIPHTFDTRALTAAPPATAGRGFVLNYDAYAQTLAHSPLAIWSEARYFDPAGVFSSTGIAYLYDDRQRYLRYDTSWTRSAGDAHEHAVRRHDLVVAVVDALAAHRWRAMAQQLRPAPRSRDVPGAGAVRQRGRADVGRPVREQCAPVQRRRAGRAVRDQQRAGHHRLGNATVVTRDALGRSVSTSIPLYIDTRLLAPGLASYSVEAGFLRRAYGITSFDYAHTPAASGSLRYGISERLTVEAHAEATSGVYNAGAGVLARIGNGGVANASLAVSAQRGAGAQVGFGYQYVTPRVSIDAQTLRAFGGYGDLGAREGIPVSSATDRITVSFPFLRAQTLSFSYLGLKYPGIDASRIGSIAYLVNLGMLTSLTVSAFQDFRQRDTRGFFASVSIGLGGNTSVSASAGRQNGESTYAVNASRPPDYGGGFGWNVQAGTSAALRWAGSSAVSRPRRRSHAACAVVRRARQRVGRRHGRARADGRPADDGAPHRRQLCARLDRYGRVPVLHQNRLIGETNRAGYLLVPDLNAYQNNRVAIDGATLPADARIADTTLDVVPQARSGVLAHFAVSRYSAASIILHAPDGRRCHRGRSPRRRERPAHDRRLRRPHVRRRPRRPQPPGNLRQRPRLRGCLRVPAAGRRHAAADRPADLLAALARGGLVPDTRPRMLKSPDSSAAHAAQSPFEESP